MSYRVFVLLTLVLCTAALAQHHSEGAKPATLMSGLSDLHHPVTTSNPQAQLFFDQGLRLIYAFNHDEAARSFQHAAGLDPKMAMAYWGVAEAVGPNYNDPASEDRFKQAHEAIQKASDLSATSSPSEKAYIEAMAKRFPADPKSDLKKAAEDYRDAMREVTKQFPDDLDAATLFAESGMNLHPWGLWHQDGTPRTGLKKLLRLSNRLYAATPIILGRFITTFTLLRRRGLPSVRWPGPTAWPPSLLPPGTSSTCPPTFTFALETTSQPCAPTRRQRLRIRCTSNRVEPKGSIR